MSRLAMTAFVLAFLLGGVALFVGFWWLGLVPALVALKFLLRPDAAEYRGRAFAIFAIIGGILASTLGWVVLSGSISRNEELAEDTLRAVARPARPSASGDADAFASWWLRPDATRAGVADEIRARYAETVERFGAFTGELDAGSLLGPHPYIVVPDVSATDEIGRSDAEPPRGMLEAAWVRARFERGEVLIAFVTDDDPQSYEGMREGAQRMAEGERPRFLYDIRFYVQP